MKLKKVRRLLSVLLTFSLVFSLSNFVASAGDNDPTVTFNGSTRQFSFDNIVDADFNGHPDLFRDMKDLMPGDKIEQTIKIKAVNLGSDTVDITLRAEPSINEIENEYANEHNAAYEKLMEWATLTVEYSDQVVKGGINEPEGVQLAEFNRNEDEQTVKVTLEISKEAGNELQDLLATIDWVFRADVTEHHGSGKYYDLTVNYFDEDGNKIADSYVKRNIRKGTSYDVTDKDAIAIPGYTYVKTTGDDLTGTMDEDKVINVYYKQDEAPVEPIDPIDPVDPIDPIDPVDPPIDPVKPPKTGDISMLWLAMAAASGFGLVLLAMTSKKKEEEV